MRKLSIIVMMILFGIVGFAIPGHVLAGEPTSGMCDTEPKTFVSTLGLIQVRYNVKMITIIDMDGKTRTAYSYDYKNIPKLEKAEVEKAIPIAAATAIKDVPLIVTKELVRGYAGPDKAAYEAKFNTVDALIPK